MSTFDGIVAEFPDIRIDFFRNHPNRQPPLACFLSHVHSDHLVGLETLKSPFLAASVYCSAATREILLRLERCQCRLNYAKRILEARQQTYRHLSRVLKPLPLETPTRLELRPGHHIQVTLFDANHCPGSVMFLVEGDGKAILYTGDVRCEPWFVNSFSRNPNVIEYTHGLKSLDKLYLDTSFTKDVPFQTKAQGIADLLRQVSQYPEDTIFYIQSWTYGYEDVWLALSKALNSPIHVDDYKFRVYSSLRSQINGSRFSNDVHHSTIAASLVGFMCGNTSRPGCLTLDEGVRLHSCESGNMCEVARGKSVVRIQPIVARLPGGESMLEAGIGGGGEDLEPDIELGVTSANDLNVLLEMICASSESSDELRRKAVEKLKPAMASGRNISLNIRVSNAEQDSPEDLLNGLASMIQKNTKNTSKHRRQPVPEGSDRLTLPNVIRFPYSRHSSYVELCDLVNALKPKDIWPCTVDKEKWLRKAITIKSLFGDFCSGDIFSHDMEMEARAICETKRFARNEDSQTTGTQRSVEDSPVITETLPKAANPAEEEFHRTACGRESNGLEVEAEADCDDNLEETVTEASHMARKRKAETITNTSEPEGAGESQSRSQETERSFEAMVSLRHSRERREAYESMLRNARGQSWNTIDLLSTGCSHDTEEVEL